MPPPPPSPRPNPTHSAIYLVGMIVGAVAFIFGAFIAGLLYAAGEGEFVPTAIALGVVTFALMYSAILKMRGE